MIPINIKFIGNIGVGKTTAICRLLNLIKDNNPILDTASGRTTACDVHIWIRKDLRSSILVDQYSNTECGMYSIYFLIRMIQGESFKKFCKTSISDKWMLKFRKVLFDPSAV